MSKDSRGTTTAILIRLVAVTALLAAVSSIAAAQSLLTNLSVGSDPVAAAVNSRTNKIYVVNQNSNNLTIIDGATNQTTTVATGLLPSALAINPVTNKIYVTNGNSNTVTVVDGQSNSTTSVPTGNFPLAVDVNTVTNRIYVTNWYSNNVTVIDGATNATSTIGVGQRPLPVAVNPATNTIYIGNQSSGSISIINGDTGTVTALAVGGRPQAIAINSLTNQIYVANYQGASVSAIDGATKIVTPVAVGSYPAALAVDAVRNRVYVANAGDGTATLIDGATFATSSIAVGAYPIAVDVDAVTNTAYFATQQSYGSVTAVNGANLSMVSIAVGSNPYAVAVDAITNTIYTANEQNNTASVIAGAASVPLQFVPITPCRLVDTRSAPGPFGGPAMAGGAARSFALPQNPNCGIPATVAAYSLNVTVIPSAPLGYLTIWPTGEPQPLVSTLNSPDRRIKANAAIVPAGEYGAVSVYASDTTDLILDIDGYFQPANGQSLQFYPLTPCRVLDTRAQQGHLGGPYLHGTHERDFPVRWSTCQIPDSAQAYSLNFTVVPWQGRPLQYLSVWAAGGSQPVVSTLNNPTATVVANAAIVPAGAGGAIAVYPSQDTDLIADINGYFAAPGQGGLSLYLTAPCRVLDTRSNGGAFRGQRNPPVNVAATLCGVAGSAGGYVFNATVLPVGGLGYLTLWPDGQPQPAVSTLNAPDGITASNMAVLPVQDGRIDAYASGITQLILDISAYFAP